MNCQETQRLVMPYIQDELTPEELKDFWNTWRPARTAGKNWRFILR